MRRLEERKEENRKKVWQIGFRNIFMTDYTSIEEIPQGTAEK